MCRTGRSIAVPAIPSREKLANTLQVRVMRLDDLDLLDRIAAAEFQQWVTNPFTPVLIAAERSPPLDRGRILAAEAPDRQHRGHQFGATLFDPAKKSGTERPRFRVLALRIEFTANKPARQVL